MVNCAHLVFMFHQVFHRDATGTGQPSGANDRATYRGIHSGRDDDAVGEFGEGVIETGSHSGIEDQQGALGTAVLTVFGVLRLVAIVCERYDVELPTVPDLANAFPH